MKNIRVFLSQNFQFLEVKFSLYFDRRVFVMPAHKHSLARAFAACRHVHVVGTLRKLQAKDACL